MVEKALELYRKYREMILYLVFGGLTTLVNIFSYFVLTDVGEIQYLVSTAIAWVLSVLFAYFTNRVWVFQSTASGTKAILREIGSFFGCRLLSGAIDMGIMFLCVSVLGLPDKLIKILANVVVIILNYLFSKLFIFKKDKQAIRICLKYFLFIASFAAGVLGGYYMTVILAGSAVFISAGILALLILYMIANHLKERKADACSQ